MRQSLRICVAILTFFPSNPFATLNFSTSLRKPTHHPRICVLPYAYAWDSLHFYPTLPSPNTNHILHPPPTHMRTTLRICMAIIPLLPHTLPCFHAYACNSTHMRGNIFPAPRLSAHIGARGQAQIQVWCAIPLPPSTSTMASSSSVSVFDNHRFKTAFNKELYNSIVKNKKVIVECCIDLDEDEYPKVKEQISLRGWRGLAAPKQEICIDLIHEFYANAILTEEEMEEAGGHTFRSYVRGKVVDFSPENLRNVMRFRAQVQGAASDFETRKEHDQQLDRVLADLCIPGAT
ncbi:hypothetical protein PIB30_082920 [Stylosanthes scabra]|uniref:Putative plant transposon protein domain-containing protein n=1 Tax=Stylosanthes scabra TaxID=79078 RepID=A0ABU6YR64_9FABA|nr:hypothetical protein [Stylosanthes scabra]